MEAKFGIIKPFDEILDEIKDYLETQQSQFTDWNPGSVLRTLSEAYSHVNYIGYVDLLKYTLMAYPQHAVGIYLDEWAAPLEVYRKQGSFAICPSLVVHISPSSSVVTIPAGTRVSTSEPVPRFYVTTEDVVISPGDTSGNTPVQAEIIGVAHNCPEFYITRMLNISGVVRIENTAPASGGEDVENDRDFRERFFLYLRHGLARGTDAALRYAMKSIDGVASVDIKYNLPAHWQRWQASKFEYIGTWYDVNANHLHYQTRKVGTGKLRLRFWGHSIRLHFWRSPNYGEIEVDFGDGTVKTLNLEDAATRKSIMEHDFETEKFQDIIVDTGENEASFECADIRANYMSSMFVYIDDGTGDAGWILVQEAYDELDNWAGITAQYFVNRCEKRFVSLEFQVKVRPGIPIIREALIEAIIAKAHGYVNSLIMGQTLYMSQLQRAILELDELKDCVPVGSNIIPEKNEILRIKDVEAKIV